MPTDPEDPAAFKFTWHFVFLTYVVAAVPPDSQAITGARFWWLVGGSAAHATLLILI